MQEAQHSARCGRPAAGGAAAARHSDGTPSAAHSSCAECRAGEAWGTTSGLVCSISSQKLAKEIH